MAIEFLKRLMCQLPDRYQQAIKRRVYRRQMQAGRFVAPEWEFNQLERWVNPGDWVIDVGANIGHYTKRFSDLVGPNGRVFALEPVPNTFEILAANASQFSYQNTSLLNLAATNISQILHIDVPSCSNGLKNYFLASVAEGGEGLPVMGQPLDGLGINKRVKLVKVDVEGHEIAALRGMRKLLERDHPVLIVEGECQQVRFFLTELGYRFEQQSGSVNRVFLPLAQAYTKPRSAEQHATHGEALLEDCLWQQGAYGNVGQIDRVANSQISRH